MKLTNTQIKCLEEMKYDIDQARKYDTFEEYKIATDTFLAGQDNPVEYFNSHKDYYEGYRKYYENYRNGIVLVSGYGKPTLKALEKKGIVSVVEYTGYRNNGVVIDWVKLNNY